MSSVDEVIFVQVENNILMTKVRKIIDMMLDDREKQVVTLRYGLDGDKAYTQKEVAEKLGISRSYISRIENKVLKMIKESFGDNDFK